MKKIKRKLIVGIILCSFSTVLLIVGISVSNTYHKKLEAVSYLTTKYGTVASEYELVKYCPKKLINNSSNTSNIFEFYFTNEKWKFKYKDRTFYVERINNVFYDDYQLEDISYWAKSYLTDNVDSNIMGIEISSEFLYNPTLPNLPTNTNEILDYERTVQLLFNSKSDYRKTINIYYFVEDQDLFRNSVGHGNDDYDKLKESIEMKLDTNNNNLEINLMLFDDEMSFERFDKKIQKGFSCEVYGIPYGIINQEHAYY